MVVKPPEGSLSVLRLAVEALALRAVSISLPTLLVLEAQDWPAVLLAHL
jgi:hypothetical protein